MSPQIQFVSDFVVLAFAIFWLMIIIGSKPSYSQKMAVVFCACMCIICLAEIGLKLATSYSMAISAQKLLYVGTCGEIAISVPFYANLVGIHLKRRQKYLIGINSTFIILVASTMGKNKLLYTRVYASVIDHRFVLQREHGIVWYWYFASVIISILLIIKLGHDSVKKGRSVRQAMLFSSIYFIPVTGYIINHYFDKIPVNVFMICIFISCMLLTPIVIHRNYDVNTIGIENIINYSENGFIVADNYNTISMINDRARLVLSDVRELNKGDDLPESLLDKIKEIKSGGNCQPIKYGEKIYKIEYEEIRKGKQKPCGYIINLNDITEEERRRKLSLDYSRSLEGQVEQRTRALLSAHDTALSGFSEIVESKDSTTGGHIKRTSTYVYMIAEKMIENKLLAGASMADFPRKLRMLAPLHDIGKITIDDSILDKPGKLTPEEFEIMKTHTVNGAKIIDRLMKGNYPDEEYEIARNIALYHHERYDGTGYPEGKKRDFIPLEARIMSVADVFDALTSVRHYKKALSLSETLNIMEKGRGSQFDPEVYDSFIDCLPLIKEILDSSTQEGKDGRNSNGL